MEFNSPPGYKNVVPFDKDVHGHLGIRPDIGFEFARELNAIYVTTTEILQAAHDYPVIFATDQSKAEYVPVAVTGFQAAKNLYLDKQNQWRANAYIPAYIRRYPFCVADIRRTESGPLESLICVDEDALDETDTRFFDEAGNASKDWQKIETFLKEYEVARKTTALVCKAMQNADIFELFEAQAFHQEGQQFNLKNMHRVSEKKLAKQSAKVLKEFVQKQYMFVVYAHLMSLENFQQLLGLSRAQ